MPIMFETVNTYVSIHIANTCEVLFEINDYFTSHSHICLNLEYDFFVYV